MEDYEQPLTADGAPAAPNTLEMLRQAINPATDLDLSSIGSTGLKHMGGLVREELLPQLDGQNGTRIYREMSENDPVISGILYTIDKIIRQCQWTVEPASSAQYDQDAAEFLEGCLEDMEVGFIELISEILTMLPYGFSAHECVYKLRAGENDDPSLNSQYDDGRTGWRGLPIRSQDTVLRWNLDDNGQIKGLVQLAPPLFHMVEIPANRMLLFRTSVHKNNPEGKSILRGAYRSWYFKSRIEVCEAIGAERDLAGLPIAWVPPEILNPNQTDGQKKAIFNAVKGIVTGVRQDSQAAIIMPLAYDAAGNKLFDFGLVSAGGARQFDTDKIIQRWDNRIAITMLADFILMGQSSSSTGSFAMHTDKTKLFLVALTAYLNIIADVFNKVAIPRLFKFNSFPVSKFPKIKPGSIEGADLGVLGPYLTVLSQIGMPLFPNPTLEEHLLKMGGLPARANEAPVDLDQQVAQAMGAAGVPDDGLGAVPAPAAPDLAPAAAYDPMTSVVAKRRRTRKSTKVQK